MSKAVMLSIHPKFCELIASGKKTVEVRKTLPKLQTPFKCYIYCTKDAKKHYYIDEYGDRQVELIPTKIIGEFVCDRIELLPESIIKTDCYELSADTKRIVAESCLTREEVLHYMGDNVLLYGWHISDLQVYDTPKELGEFNGFKKCAACKVSGYEVGACIHDENCLIPVPLTRPFQSWGYVEPLEEID